MFKKFLILSMFIIGLTPHSIGTPRHDNLEKTKEYHKKTDLEKINYKLQQVKDAKEALKKQIGDLNKEINNVIQDKKKEIKDDIHHYDETVRKDIHNTQEKMKNKLKNDKESIQRRSKTIKKDITEINNDIQNNIKKDIDTRQKKMKTKLSNLKNDYAKMDLQTDLLMLLSGIHSSTSLEKMGKYNIRWMKIIYKAINKNKLSKEYVNNIWTSLYKDNKTWLNNKLSKIYKNNNVIHKKISQMCIFNLNKATEYINQL